MIVRKSNSLNAFVILCMGMLLSVLLTGCQRIGGASPKTQSQSTTKQVSNNSSFKFYFGDVDQSAGIISAPVIISNSGKQDMTLVSKNFSLDIDGNRVKLLHVPGEANDFHVNMNSGDNWSNVISFYVGGRLSNADISRMKMIYTTDDGVEHVASNVSASKLNSILGNDSGDDSSSENTISSYYQNMKNYLKEQKENNSSSGGNTDSVNSLKDEFNDSKYDHLRTWMVVSYKDPSTVLIKVLNETNTDFTFSLNNLEFVDSSGEETKVASDYSSFQIDLLHGKSTTVVVPLESKLSKSNAPYQVKLLSDDNSSSDSDNDDNYFSTSATPYPIELAMNNATDYSSVFQAQPDELNDSSMQWGKGKISWSNDTLSISVSLSDVFSIKNDFTKYKLVGIERDGTKGDVESATDGAPSKVDNSQPADLKIKFSNLKNLKTYKKIYLQYGSKTLTRIK